MLGLSTQPSTLLPQTQTSDVHQAPASQQLLGIHFKTPEPLIPKPSAAWTSLPYPSSWFHSAPVYLLCHSTSLKSYSSANPTCKPCSSRALHPPISVLRCSAPSEQDLVQLPKPQSVSLGARKNLSTLHLHACVDTFSKLVSMNVSTKLLLSFTHFIQ